MLAAEIDLPYVVAADPGLLIYPLPAGMRLFASEDLRVTIEDAAGAVVFTPVLGTHYTVQRPTTGAATVTFLANTQLLSGRMLVFDPRAAIVQPIRFSELEELPGVSIELQADREVTVLRQMDKRVTRALLARRGETLPPLPAKASILGRLFWLNAAGTGYETFDGSALPPLAGLAARADLISDLIDNMDTLDAIAARLDVSNYAALRALTISDEMTSLRILGHTMPSDGGEGDWIIDHSDAATADNGGTVLVSANGKRVKRIYNGRLQLPWFGAKGDGSADDSAAFFAACALQAPIAGLADHIYRIAARWLPPPLVDVEMPASCTFKFEWTALSGMTDAERYAVYAAPLALGASHTVTYTAGTRIVSGAAALSDVEPGQMVCFFGTTLAGRWPITYRLVTAKPDADEIELDRIIPYAIGGTVTMRRVSFKPGFRWVGGQLDLSGVTDGTAEVLGAFNLASYALAEFRPAKVIGIEFDDTDTDYLLVTNYCYGVITSDYVAEDLQMNGGVTTVFNSAYWIAENINWSGDGFGLAPVNCDWFWIDDVVASGQYNTSAGSTAIRGIRPIGCLEGAIGSAYIYDYESGVKLEDCANISTHGLVTDRVDRPFAISDQYPSDRSRGHILSGFHLRNYGASAIALGASTANAGKWGIKISGGKIEGFQPGATHTIIANGGSGGLTIEDVQVDDWPSGTHPLVTVDHPDGDKPRGRLSAFEAFAPVATGRLGINVPAGQTAFWIDDFTVQCNAPAGRFAARPPLQAFPGSLAASGYQRLPNGLIFQWARAAAVPAGFTNYSFPISFPTACLGVVAVARGGSASNNVVTGPISASVVGLACSTAGTDCDYLAWGY